MADENLLVDRPVTVATSRRRKLYRAPRPLPIFFDEKPLYWHSISVPDGNPWHHGFCENDTVRRLGYERGSGAIGDWCRAVLVPELRWVVYDVDLIEPENRKDLQRIYGHETLHKPFNDEPNVAASIFRGRTERSATMLEESFCERASSIFPTLFDHGILRLPRLPKRRAR